MNNQLLFLLSAIGGLNGLALSAYFAFFVKNKSKSTYFLAGLLLAVSLRITKSAFLYFNGASNIVWFIQFGLIACALIGPFLYLYIREERPNIKTARHTWFWHIVPVMVLLIVSFYIFPYQTEHVFWNRMISWGIYWQWFIYTALSIVMVKGIFKKLVNKTETLNTKDIWLLNLVVGVFVIWLAYRTTRYTSYIVGALSFSFVFYISLWLWIIKRKQPALFFETQKKYQNKTIEATEVNKIAKKLETVFKTNKLYKNPELKLNHLAEAVEVSPHQLSQFLNNNLQKSFNKYINEFRIEEAKQLLQTNHQFTLEAIGYEAGFSSKSTFYATFKKVVGVTPAQFRKQITV